MLRPPAPYTGDMRFKSVERDYQVMVTFILIGINILLFAARRGEPEGQRHESGRSRSNSGPSTRPIFSRANGTGFFTSMFHARLCT